MTPRVTPDPAVVRDGELPATDGLVQLSFLVQNELARCAGEHHLSLIQTRLLGILRDREPSMHQLASLLDLDKSSVTGLINRAEGRGLVRRMPSPADRRTVLVALTDEARSLIGTIARQFDARITEMLAAVSPADQRHLSRLVSDVLVSHAHRHGVDLFATIGAEPLDEVHLER